jgi:hypothetical protein
MYGQPDHDHSEYAQSSDLDVTRHDLERQVDDERNDRRATREELLSEIQGLREHVGELEGRIASLERLAGQIADQHI